MPKSPRSVGESTVLISTAWLDNTMQYIPVQSGIQKAMIAIHAAVAATNSTSVNKVKATENNNSTDATPLHPALQTAVREGKGEEGREDVGRGKWRWKER